MKTMTTSMMMPQRRMINAMKALQGKRHRSMPNHNVHIITPHGNVMLGRKGRKA